MTTLWLAEYDTRNFTFTAAGATREQALEALEAGLERHALRTGSLLRGWFRQGMSRDEWREEVNVLQITAGHAYRDGSEL